MAWLGVDGLGWNSRQNNGLPKISSSLEPLNMLLYVAKGTLQMWLRSQILRSKISLNYLGRLSLYEPLKVEEKGRKISQRCSDRRREQPARKQILP